MRNDRWPVIALVIFAAVLALWRGGVALLAVTVLLALVWVATRHFIARQARDNPRRRR